MISRDEACRTITEGLAALGLDPLPASGIERLWGYFTELNRWNRTMNLVAKASDLEVIETHFLDSLTILPEIETGPVLDVGSGAGFPGLVIKIARPAYEVTLVEPRQKRVTFLRHLIRTLGLTGIAVADERIVPKGGAFAEAHGRFPTITSRALAEIAPFLDLVEEISSPGGAVICMKGPRAAEELNTWQAHAGRSPYTLARRVSFRLPTSAAERTLVVFRKNAAAQTECDASITDIAP